VNDSTPRHAAFPEQPSFTIATQNLEAEQIAAVTAVLQAAIAGAASSESERIETPPTGWEKSRRDLRMPIHPGPGEWRRAR
jgi:hypothetical protein